MNPVFYLIIILALLLIGHVFVNTILSRSINPNASNDSWRDSFTHNLKQIRFSILQSIEAINILPAIILSVFIGLFWGWSPALLLIIIGHLVVSSCLSVMTDFKNKYHPSASIKDFYQTNVQNVSILQLKSNRQFYAWLILFSFCAFFSACLISLTSDILSLNSGALILIIFLGIAAYSSLTIEHSFIKVVTILILILIGLALSNNMGLYLIGRWQPISSFEMLTIDERWLFTAIVIATIYILRGQTLKANVSALPDALITQWHYRLSQLSKFANLSLIILIMLFLIIKRPAFDAPMHAYSEGLPNYIKLIALILFFSIGNLVDILDKVFNPNKQTHTTNEPETLAQQRINQVSSLSLITSFCAIIILFLFASSTGIGAWQTHFSSWTPDRPVIELLSIAIDSFTNALTIYGLSEVAAKNVIASCLLLNLILLLIKLMRLGEQCMGMLQSMTKSRFRVRTNNCIVVVFLTLTFLMTSLSTNVWLALGILSICGTLIIAIDLFDSIIESEMSHPFVWLGVSLLIIITLLALPQIIIWAKQKNILGPISGITVSISGFVISHKIKTIFLLYKETRNKTEVDLEQDD